MASPQSIKVFHKKCITLPVSTKEYQVPKLQLLALKVMNNAMKRAAKHNDNQIDAVFCQMDPTHAAAVWTMTNGSMLDHDGNITPFRKREREKW